MRISKAPSYKSVLRDLLHRGFVRQPTAGGHRYYRHPNGAVILLPNRPLTAKVEPVHLAMIRTVLEDYRLAEKNGRP